MTNATIDPLFVPYLRDPPRISYCDPDDDWLTRRTISSLEVLAGRREVEAVYQRLKHQPFDIAHFFHNALQEASINVHLSGTPINQLPAEGPLLFVANHPFGVVDGMVLCDIAAQLRGNLRIMLHSLLCQDRDLAPYFLPIDFSESKQARKTNIRAKQLALEGLAANVPVIIFPSGMVSTARKMGFGKVTDSQWSTFAAKIIQKAQATVVPVYFSGRNSRAFHVASHIAEPLRMALLLHEALRQFGRSVQVNIGQPLPWDQLEAQGNRKQLTHYLYHQVQALGDTPKPNIDNR